MITYVSKMSLAWGIFAYGITLSWIALNWFYIRPRSIRKQEGKINELIEQFERLNKQVVSE